MSWEKTILTFDIKKVNDDDDDNHDDNFQKGLVTQSTYFGGTCSVLWHEIFYFVLQHEKELRNLT